MNLADAIPQDDLLLARLVCSKLAKVVNGIVSVGAATLELESPTDFLAGKDKIVLGFLEVLRCIGVKPGHADKVELLRRQADQLSELAVLFHSRFMELTRWRAMSPEAICETVGRFSAVYGDFFQALEAFSSLLGMDDDYSSTAQQGKRRVGELLQTLVEPRQSSTSGA
jgi:hypothetical protein